jgi:hypothetical protein
VIVFAAVQVAVVSVPDETVIVLQPVTGVPAIWSDATNDGVLVPPV